MNIFISAYTLYSSLLAAEKMYFLLIILMKVDYYIRMSLINANNYLFNDNKILIKKKVKETLFKRKLKGSLVNLYPGELHH